MELFTWTIPTEMVVIVLGGIAYIILSIVKWRYCYKKYKKKIAETEKDFEE